MIAAKQVPAKNKQTNKKKTKSSIRRSIDLQYLNQYNK